MTRLSKRLARLEARVPAESPWSVSVMEVDRVALAQLSAEDRRLVEEARAKGPTSSLRDSHPAVWDRWDEALGEAIRETPAN